MRSDLIIRRTLLLSIHLFLIPFLAFSQIEDTIWTKFSKDLNSNYTSGNLEKAMEIANKRKTYVEQLDPTDPRLGVAHTEMGLIFIKEKKYDSAIFHFKKSINNFIEYYKNENYNSAIARSLLGLCYYKTDQLLNALKECEKAELTFKPLDVTDKRIIENYSTLSDIYFTLSDIDNSIYYLDKAIERTKTNYSDNHESLLNLYIQLGYLEYENKNYDAAKRELENALIDAEKKQKYKEQAFVCNYLGLVYVELKQFNKARNYFNRAKSNIAASNLNKTEQDGSLVSIYLGMGQLYKEKNKLDSSIFYLISGEELANQNSNLDPFISASLFQEMGNVFLQLKKYKNSENYYKKSASFLTRNEPILNNKKADIYFHLGEILTITNRKDSANYYFKQAALLVQVNEIKEYREFIKLSNKGDNLYNQGKYQDAVAEYKKSLEHGLKAIKGNHDEIAHTYYRIGLNYGKESKYKEAIENMIKAQLMWEKLYGSQNRNSLNALNHLYDYYFKSGQKQKADEVEAKIKLLIN